MKQIIYRMSSPTPAFFIKLRNIGITAGAIGAALLASPVAIPAAILSVAGYLTVAGTVTGIISQAVTKPEF